MEDRVTAERQTGYVHGHEAASKDMAARTAENFAAFFVPRLSPGMSLLDVGCGPGTITLGLAQLVAPGRVIGIDMGPSEVAKAAKLASEKGLTNTSFELGDAVAMRFGDAAFDVVYSSNALEHVPDSSAAVREIARVLKPGGVLGVKGGLASCNRLVPEPRETTRVLEIYLAVWKDMGGHPEMGIEQLQLLKRAGLSIEEVSGTFHTRQAQSIHFSERLVEQSFMQRANSLGVEPSELKKLAEGIAAWEQDPEAFLLQAVVQVVAKKPM